MQIDHQKKYHKNFQELPHRTHNVSRGSYTIDVDLVNEEGDIVETVKGSRHGMGNDYNREARAFKFESPCDTVIVAMILRESGRRGSEAIMFLSEPMTIATITTKRSSHFNTIEDKRLSKGMDAIEMLWGGKAVA